MPRTQCLLQGRCFLCRKTEKEKEKEGGREEVREGEKERSKKGGEERGGQRRGGGVHVPTQFRATLQSSLFPGCSLTETSKLFSPFNYLIFTINNVNVAFY